jgi:hypothetical protein
VIPPLAVGGLTLGAAVGDLLAFDVLPSPPSAVSKPVDSGLIAKAVVPSKPPAKPAETSAPPAAKPATAVTPTPPPTKVTPPPAITPPAAKPSAPAPTISVESISPLAFGGLTLGATFGDLIALEKFPAPPLEATTNVPAAVPAAPPATTSSSALSQPAKPPLAPKPSKNQAKQQPPPLDLHWGMIPLSTISPAFVYGDVPPPVERRP